MNKLHYTIIGLMFLVIFGLGAVAAPHLYGGQASTFPEGIQPVTIYNPYNTSNYIQATPDGGWKIKGINGTIWT